MSASTRVVFSEDFVRAVQIRGMTLRSLAKVSGVSIDTISSAASGKQVNMCTAIALSKALASTPVIAELDQLVAHAGSRDADVAA